MKKWATTSMCAVLVVGAVACSRTSSDPIAPDGGTVTPGPDGGIAIAPDGGTVVTPGPDGGTMVDDGGTTSPDPDAGANVGCAFTLSGATTESVGHPGDNSSCFAIAAWLASTKTVTFELTPDDGQTRFSADLSMTEVLVAKTYTGATVLRANASTAGPNVNTGWAMYAHQAGQTDQGTFSLTITSTGPNASDAWRMLHGTISVTMPADGTTSATGSVTLQGTF